MKRVGESLELIATDLVGYLNCLHLSALYRAVMEGTLSKPKVWDQILSAHGTAHEQSHIEHLRKAALDARLLKALEVLAPKESELETAE